MQKSRLIFVLCTKGCIQRIRVVVNLSWRDLVDSLGVLRQGRHHGLRECGARLLLICGYDCVTYVGVLNW